MAAESQRGTEALEATRRRLLGLTDALYSLRREVEMTDTLPPWTDIQNALTLIAQRLSALSKVMTENDGFLSTAHAYPLPTFPRQAQEMVLGQLLRTKLDPSAEEWVEGGTKTAAEVAEAAGGASLSADELSQLWGFAIGRVLTIADNVTPKLNLDYTLEELGREEGIESVVTGIRRELNHGTGSDDDDEDDEDEEDEEVEDVSGEANNKMEVDTAPKDSEPAKQEKPAPMMPIEDLLKLASTGVVPKQPMRVPKGS